MYRLPLLLFSFVIIIIGCSKKTVNGATATPEIPEEANTGHPRILLLKNEESQILQSISSDALLKKVHDVIIAESDKMISLPVLERVLTGRRLLGVSREAIRRIFFLSYSWRMTKNDKYYLRAQQEMLNVSNFTDWNPSHFLDVAEMTLGLAIGYDWLYEKLSPETRKTIQSAIIKKGIEPSYTGSHWWIKGTNNWNQVCHAGLSYGALAIYENYKDTAEMVMKRAVESLPYVMNMYNPDGAYPEGYGYWSYGTTFNVLFIDAYEKFKKTNYDLSALLGFMKTASYLLNMVGPSGNAFNYSDAGLKGAVQPAMYWFADKLNDLSLLYFEKELLSKSSASALAGDRSLPALLVWAKGKTMNGLPIPSKKMWAGRGENPVAIMRSSWTDPNAIFLGLKCGTPSASHGHLDVGSFVMDADGERWASDFGMQDYNSLESKGVDLWNMNQNSQRWTIFRYNNLAHNTLSFNNQYQIIKGTAPLSSYSSNSLFMNAVSDLSGVYQGQIAEAKRGVAIMNEKYVLVRDEVKTGATATTLRWTMLTTATATIVDNSTILLTKGSKKIYVKVNSSRAFTLKTWSTVSPNSFDAPNPGTILIGFESNLPAGATESFNVFLSPERNLIDINYNVQSLINWPKD